MTDVDEIFKYIWLCSVSFLGGVIGYAKKYAPADYNKTLPEKIRSIFMSIVTSMFIAYIVYELSSILIEKTNVCVALAGLASFAGTDALVAFEKGFLGSVGRLLEKLIK